MTGRPRAGWTGAAALVSVVVASYLALLIAPEDAVQGPAQRLMYVHVPAVLAAYGCFAGAAVASLKMLAGRPDWRWVAQAAAEVGVLLLTLGTAVGSLWGHLVWGTWWTWDPRLTSTAALLLAFAAVSLALRWSRTAATLRHAAVGCLVSVALVPVVHFSVAWWRSLHQEPTVLAPRAPLLDPRMAVALLAATLAACLVGLVLVRRRVRRLEPTGPQPAHAPRTVAT